MHSGIHFFFLDEIAAVGGTNALFDCSQEMVSLSQDVRGRFCQELLDWLALMQRELREMGFLFSGEVDFHI